MRQRKTEDVYIIMGSYQGGEAEEIDETLNYKEVSYLKSEYRLAFGAGWSIWHKKTRRKKEQNG